MRRGLLLGANVLCAATLGAQATPLPRLVLSRLTITLDSATYHDVATSPFLLGQFAAYVNATSSQSVPCAGVCLIGRHSYLEVRGPDHFAGSAGLTLASERAGGLDVILAHERAVQLPFDTTTWSRADSTGSFPALLRWRATTGVSTSQGFSLSVTEYLLAAAQRAKVADSQPDEDRSRDRFLTPLMLKDQLFAEITAATLAVPVKEIAVVRTRLLDLGVGVLDEGEGVVIPLSGFTLRLEPAWEKAGVRKLEFALSREALANPTYHFGPVSRLLFGPGRVAVWEF